LFADDALASMFLLGIPQPSPPPQAKELAHTLGAHLASRAKKAPALAVLFDSQSRELLVRIGEALMHPADSISFHDNYGSAEVRVADPFDPLAVTVHVVCLDSWRFAVHSTEAERANIAKAGSCTTVVAGKVAVDRLPLFDAMVDAVRRSALNKTGKNRHAVFGAGGGHQKTPAFMTQVIRTAVEHTAAATDPGALSNAKVTPPEVRRDCSHVCVPPPASFLSALRPPVVWACGVRTCVCVCV
jgi:hypothetical protein